MEGLQVCLWCPLRAYFSKCGGNCGVNFSREVRSFIVDSTLYSLCILRHSRTMEPGQFWIRTLYEILGNTIWDFEYEYSRIIWVWIHQFRYISCNWPNRYNTTHGILKARMACDCLCAAELGFWTWLLVNQEYSESKVHFQLIWNFAISENYTLFSQSTIRVLIWLVSLDVVLCYLSITSQLTLNWWSNLATKFWNISFQFVSGCKPKPPISVWN